MKTTRTSIAVWVYISLNLAICFCEKGLAQTGLIPYNSAIAKGTNSQVNVLWPATPGSSYLLTGTTNLSSTFTSVVGVSTNLTTSTNYISVPIPATNRAQFFQLSRRDIESPVITNVWPMNGSHGIYTQEAITVEIINATGVNSNSITIQVGTNAPVHWPNSRLTFNNNYLTYTLNTNEVWGSPGSNVTATLSVADTLGHAVTNTWFFGIYSPVVLSSNVVFVDTGNTNGTGPHLTLQTNLDAYTLIYSYVGTSPGLTNGMCLLNTNLIGTNNYSYGRVVRGFTATPSNHTVTVFVRRATLHDIFNSGDIRIHVDMPSSLSAPSAAKANGAPPSSSSSCASLGNIPIWDLDPSINLSTTPDSQVCVSGSIDWAYYLGIDVWNDYFGDARV